MREDIFYLLKERAVKGCSYSFDYIFETYKPIVYRSKKVYHLYHYETDDWLQEGRIVCFKSLQTYDVKRGATFGSYFRMNFKNHIFSLIRRQEAHKRRVDKECITCGGDIDMLSHVIENRPLETIKYIFYKENAFLFAESLSDYERQVFVKYTLEQECKMLKEKRALTRIKKKFVHHYINS